MANMNLAVLYGSRTCEHDVSIISAVQLMDAAEEAGYQVIPVYIARSGAWYTGQALRDIAVYKAFDERDIRYTRVILDTTSGTGDLWQWPPRRSGLLFGHAQEPFAHIDVAVPVFHGMNGEDGSIQGMLELANVPYTSAGVLGCAVGMDKIAMKNFFRGCGFPVIDGEWFSRDGWEKDREGVLALLEEKLPYPMFVKPANLGSSIGISRATDRESLVAAIEVAVSFDRRVLVERGVQKPREVNCAALGYGAEVMASVCEMPLTGEEFLTYEEKYLRGSGSKGEQAGGSKGMQSLSRIVPAPISDEMTAKIQALTCDIFKALDCKGSVRIDFMIDQESGALFVNEANIIPGSLAFYLWKENGIEYPQLVDKMVEYALYAHADKNRNVFAYDSTILQSVQRGAKGGAKGGAKLPRGAKR